MAMICLEYALKPVTDGKEQRNQEDYDIATQLYTYLLANTPNNHHIFSLKQIQCIFKDSMSKFVNFLKVEILSHFNALRCVSFIPNIPIFFLLKNNPQSKYTQNYTTFSIYSAHYQYGKTFLILYFYFVITHQNESIYVSFYERSIWEFQSIIWPTKNKLGKYKKI